MCSSVFPAATAGEVAGSLLCRSERRVRSFIHFFQASMIFWGAGQRRPFMDSDAASRQAFSVLAAWWRAPLTAVVLVAYFSSFIVPTAAMQPHDVAGDLDHTADSAVSFAFAVEPSLQFPSSATPTAAERLSISVQETALPVHTRDKTLMRRESTIGASALQIEATQLSEKAGEQHHLVVPATVAPAALVQAPSPLAPASAPEPVEAKMRWTSSFHSDMVTLFPFGGFSSNLGEKWDGNLPVLGPIDDETTRMIVGEENRACLQEMSIAECMDRLGSYGVRRLYSYTFAFIEEHGWARPEWMSNPAVQKQKLLDVTLPMSHASTAFEIYDDYVHNLGKGPSVTAVKQVFDVYQQLRLGIRALDIPVVYHTRAKHLYGISAGRLTVSLIRVLADIRLFLEESIQEVVVLDLRMGTLTENSGFASLAPLQREAENVKKLPGQMVHDLVVDVLGEFIADYDKLSLLRSEGGDAENPSIATMVAGSARAVYFWEGQQVLCTSVERCLRTPGWQKLDKGQKFAFGAPMILGTRPKPASARKIKVLEPLCINPSEPGTRSEDPVTLLTQLRSFATRVKELTGTQRPDCYPPGVEIPGNHEPTLIHKLDAYLNSSEDHDKELEHIFHSHNQDFVHGEALTYLSTSERMNYLLLLWVFLKGNQKVYRQMNIISMDNVHPTIVQRIVAAVQDQPECGYVLHCRETGSCFAADLHAADDNRCLDQISTQRDLWSYSEGRYFSWQVRYGLLFTLWLLVKFLLLTAFLGSGSEADDGADGGQKSDGSLDENNEKKPASEGAELPLPPPPPPPLDSGVEPGEPPPVAGDQPP
eukprot:TRINITY_DN9964_c0_g2_i1.p1 TRINITY_DN9964_c0_g2~~TRINITY_DN9964_c0_g2_i1.p1  ORF type:complete len:819 (-),score=103.16 TRINITY_DN9964_c0_g2_i1:192-2648(-)